MKFDVNENIVRITVGICVRNSESTVGDAIESVVSQNYPHELMKLIIVDGCSRDNTLKILKNRLKGEDIVAQYFSENEGISKARQLVVENAMGDYIIWVDGDMVISTDFVTRHVEFMERHPSAGIAKGRYVSPIDDKHMSLVAKLENVEFLLETTSEGELSSKSLGASGCIYRVKAIKQIGGFDPRIRHGGEDTDAEIRIRKRGWSTYISPASFSEIRRENWKSLWNEYFWHGRSGAYLIKKNQHIYNFRNMFPPVAVLAELSRVPTAYKLTRQTSVFFLPFHYVFKRMAWFCGFLKSFRGKNEPGK